MSKALQLKGVKKLDMDFDNKLFTLQVDGKTSIKPSDLKKSLPKRFKVEGFVVEGLSGTVRKDGDAVLFKPNNLMDEYVVVKGKEAKAYDELVAKLGEGKTAFKLGGTPSETKEKKDDKEVDVLKLEIVSCAVVEEKK